MTLRERLSLHRERADCAGCHEQIDPLGFALENFDPIGAWRTEYGRKLPVDASGKLPSGEAFKDITELRTLLIERHELFTRSLAENLMTYALGREVEVGDRPAIDRICEDMADPKKGLRDLIKAIVASESFLHN